MGLLKQNKETFKHAMLIAFGIEENDYEQVVGGYRFLFDSETNTYIRVEFVDNGCQLKTTIYGELAEDVISVYKEFSGRFC